MSHFRFKVVEEAFDRKPVKVDIPQQRPSEYYAQAVFNRKKMYDYLSRSTYDALTQAIDNGKAKAQPIFVAIGDVEVAAYQFVRHSPYVGHQV